MHAADQTWDGGTTASGSNGGGSAWLTNTNWLNDPLAANIPGSASTTTNTDTATFQTNGTSATIGINMNTTVGKYYLGAISMTAGISRSIGDSSATAGTLTLNGATVNSFANVILSNTNTNNLTIAATQTGTMGLALGNATENNIVIGSSGNIVISSTVSSSSGTRPLTVTGAGSGRVDITNTVNTFTGNINVTGAEVRFTADGSLGNAANTITIDGGRFGIVSGGLVDLSARNIFLGATAGTSISAPGATGVLTYNGVLQNKSGSTGLLVKQGAGTLALGGVSTYTGDTSINNGTLQITTGNDRLPTGTSVNIGQSGSTNLGTLDLNGFSQQIAGLNSIEGTNVGATKNTVTSATAATLTLGGSGNYSYGTDKAPNPTVNSGVITGSISVIKNGNGTQTLGDANTYTGNTTVDAGTLIVQNTTGSGTGSGAVSVTAGPTHGTLGGTGIINATSVMVSGDGTTTNNAVLRVGNTNGNGGTAGNLIFAGTTLNVTLGGMVQFDLFSRTSNINTYTAGNNDLLTFSGAGVVSFGSTAIVQINNSGLDTATLVAGDSWKLIDWTTFAGDNSTRNATFALPTLSGFTVNTSDFYNGGTVFLEASSAPEPSRAILMVFGAAGLLLRRRRKMA